MIQSHRYEMTAKVGVDDLIQEIRDNAKKDRAVLEEVRDNLINTTVGSSKSGEDCVQGPVLAETVARLSESLTRVNMQLIEIAKIRLKERIISEKNESESKGDLFDEIGDGFGYDRDEETN